MAKYHQQSFLKYARMRDDKFLGLNQLPTIAPTSEDELYPIDAVYDQRPDLLAHQIYGSSRLWWVFSLRNPDILKDPIGDFRAGVYIYLPSAGSVGGI